MHRDHIRAAWFEDTEGDLISIIASTPSVRRIRRSGLHAGLNGLGLTADDDSSTITRSIGELGQVLHLGVTVMGVETLLRLAFLDTLAGGS